MCEHCGHQHPEFNELAPEIFLLDRAMSHLADLEADKPENGFSVSVNPYSVDFFSGRRADVTTSSWMRQEVVVNGKDPIEATEKLAQSMFLFGFSIALLTRDYWSENYPGLLDQVAVPTDEEVSAFVEDQKKRAEELAKKVPTEDQILQALKNAGIPIPENVEIINPGGDDKKQTGDESPGMYL